MACGTNRFLLDLKWSCTLALVACSCGRPPESYSYEQIASLYRQGQFTNAINLAERQIKRYKAEPHSDQVCQLRLAEAEALLYRDSEGDAARAQTLLSVPLNGHRDAGAVGLVSRLLQSYADLQ